MWTEPSRTSNKRDLEDEEPKEDLNENQPKRVRFEEEPSIAPTKEELLFLQNSPGPEGLYNSDKDLWVQYNMDRIPPRTGH